MPCHAVLPSAAGSASEFHWPQLTNTASSLPRRQPRKEPQTRSGERRRRDREEPPPLGPWAGPRDQGSHHGGWPGSGPDAHRRLGGNGVTAQERWREASAGQCRGELGGEKIQLRARIWQSKHSESGVIGRGGKLGRPMGPPTRDWMLCVPLGHWQWKSRMRRGRRQGPALLKGRSFVRTRSRCFAVVHQTLAST